MYRQSSIPTPPPSFARKYSHSSSSSAHSRSGAFSPKAEREIIPPVPNRNPSHGSTHALKGDDGIARPEQGVEGQDEIDRIGYIYSLRVAILHQQLNLPPPTPTSLRSPSLLPPSPAQTPASPQPRTPTSYFPSYSSPSPSSYPSPPPIPLSPSFQPPPSRRKSAFSLLKKKDQDSSEGNKLPKEFLVEFWGVLGGEEAKGNEVWAGAVRGFLGRVDWKKSKGSKGVGGENLREVGVVLEVFTSSIPQSSTSPAHIHQTHFLSLLSNHLPRSSHFNPLSRQQSEKDRDLLFRLRVEVGSYLPTTNTPTTPNPPHILSPQHGLKVASPDLREDKGKEDGVDESTWRLSGLGVGTMDSGATSPSLKGSSPGLGRGRAGGVGGDGKRKPSPIWNGAGMGEGDWVELVRDIWGVEKGKWEGDVRTIKGEGLIQLYINDLKQAISTLQTLPNLSSTRKSRHARLSQQLSTLLQTHSDQSVSIPNSPVSSHSHNALLPFSEYYFTPPSQLSFATFLRLNTKSKAISTPDIKPFVEKCSDIWGIPSRQEREAEVEGLIPQWEESIGTREEFRLGRELGDGISDLTLAYTSTTPFQPLSPVLEGLLDNLLERLQVSVSSIFPTSSVPPPKPSPSVLLLLDAGWDMWYKQGKVKGKIGDMEDELKGGAVGEYVMAVGEMMGGMGGGGGEGGLDGFEKVARWIEGEVGGVLKVWGDGLGSDRLNPAALILSKQLPLFCAELYTIEKPRGAASDIFGLYEVTGRLLELWQELCPGQEIAFELDAFFEPHVLAWLRDTEDSHVHEWVSRAVGMDSWIPEGENKHSQSVIDLFDFMRGSAKVILQDLPLGEYKRAVYLIDLSKTVSIAVTQYAQTVLALFQNDMNPSTKASTPTGEISSKLGGKAGSWLAKGQQAVKNLEKKKVDGFVIPAVACVKLTDMAASQHCLDDLMFALEAEETDKIIKAHKLPNAPVEKARSVFTVMISRGEGLLMGSGKEKGADGFIVVTDKEGGERLIKTRTILGREDPNWEESFEISVGSIKHLDFTAFSRQLVGKHDTLGSSTLSLDPRQYANTPSRDITLPLQPRGTVHLRITLNGADKHDVAYHLSSASRSLDRAEGDMIRTIVDRMGEFAKSVLSTDKAMVVTKVLKDKKKPRSGLTESEVESSLGGLFEYLNENFTVFSVTLPPPLRITVMLALWRRLVEVLTSLLIPPLSSASYNPSHSLSSTEVDLVFKWLTLLRNYFNASDHGVEHGVPLNMLQGGGSGYKELIMVGQYLDLPTPALKERCGAAVKGVGKAGGGTGGSSLGTEEDSERMAEVLLRIARTRPDMTEFLGAQIALLNKARTWRQASASSY